jgi:hypothetical protein
MIPCRGLLSEEKHRPAGFARGLRQLEDFIKIHKEVQRNKVSEGAQARSTACFAGWLLPMYGGIRIVAQGTEAGFEAERIRCYAIEIE